MCGNPGSHVRSVIAGRPAYRYSHIQTLGCRAKVIDGSEQIHPVLKRDALACQCLTAARPRLQPLAQGGIEPLDVGCIDDACPLRGRQSLLDPYGSAPRDPPLDVNNASFLVAFDHLDNQSLGPDAQARPTALAAGNRTVGKSLHHMAESLHHMTVGMAKVPYESCRFLTR